MGCLLEVLNAPVQTPYLTPHTVCAKEVVRLYPEGSIVGLSELCLARRAGKCVEEIALSTDAIRRRTRRTDDILQRVCAIRGAYLARLPRTCTSWHETLAPSLRRRKYREGISPENQSPSVVHDEYIQLYTQAMPECDGVRIFYVDEAGLSK